MAAGGLKVTAVNGIKVYSVTGPKNVASWQQQRSRRKPRRKDEDFLRRVELIQDLNFKTAATRIKLTADGEHLLASGIYPPQLRVYDLREMSMKFERHLTSEVVDFQALADDYSKIAFLCADRSVTLHAKFGSYYSTRIPRMGRDLTYDKWSCDLLLAASSPEIYRLNLEQGRFLAPLATRSPGVNVLGRSPVHGLIVCGGEDGALECFDLRQKAAVSRIDAVKPTGNGDQEVTAVRFDESEGLYLGVGTSSGQVLIYDLRSSAPLSIKDHMYDSPIVDIKWHESLSLSSRKIISADAKAVRIWDPETGNGMATIESAVPINDLCLIRNSGLMLLAVDSTQIPTYFIPALGPAPRWCSYLENLTEELEEGGQTTIYDDYKFVTEDDLKKLNISNLIGTNLLRAYMHGYFIDHRLYAKAKSLADPFAYDEYLKQRVNEKMEAERRSRISVKRKLPKVNRELAEKLLSQAENEEDAEKQQPNKKRKGLQPEILNDPRFQPMFTNKDFEINKKAPEYRALHPSQSKELLAEEHFEPVDASEESDAAEDDNTDDISEDDDVKPDRKGKGQKARPRLYQAKDDVHADAFRKDKSLAAEQSMPLEERVAVADRSGAGTAMTARWGSREFSFAAKSRKRDNVDGKRPNKRGVASLCSNSSRKSRRGRGS